MVSDRCIKVFLELVYEKRYAQALEVIPIMDSYM